VSVSFVFSSPFLFNNLQHQHSLLCMHPAHNPQHTIFSINTAYGTQHTAHGIQHKAREKSEKKHLPTTTVVRLAVNRADTTLAECSVHTAAAISSHLAARPTREFHILITNIILYNVYMCCEVLYQRNLVRIFI
jgi:hypothetical protein